MRLLRLLRFPAVLQLVDRRRGRFLQGGRAEAGAAVIDRARDLAGVLNAQGYRIIDDQGKPFAEIWLRKSVPASAKPAGAKGVIQFPFLAESELLGVMQLAGEAHDYRDQTIAKGLTRCGTVSSRSTAIIWA